MRDQRSPGGDVGCGVSRGNPWFRMYVDFLNDPKLICLAFEDQRHFIGVLALKSDGTLDQDCDREILNRIVSQRLWLDFSTITDVKSRLKSAALIDDNWQPLGWDKRQFKSDADVTSTERKRRQRERERQEKQQLADGAEMSRGNVTNVTRTDTDTDTESDTESDTEKRKSGAPRKKFTPPTETDLNNYAAEANLNLNGFYDYYESIGWVVGRAKNKMKCWKASARNWHRRQPDFKRQDGRINSEEDLKRAVEAAKF